MCKGSSAQKRCISAFMDPLAKIGEIKYRRNVFAVTRLLVVLIGTTAYCHWDKPGNVLRAVFDNVYEPKSRVPTDRVGIREYESILVRPPRCSQSIAGCCFHMRYCQPPKSKTSRDTITQLWCLWGTVLNFGVNRNADDLWLASPYFYIRRHVLQFARGSLHVVLAGFANKSGFLVGVCLCRSLAPQSRRGKKK